MTDPDEFEIQLGHLCNDRCVFCESGRLTRAKRAPLLEFEVLAARVREARASGHRRITFVGGEPTIQPAFLPLVELCVSLGFEAIVIFTNGSMAGRSDVVDRVLATGGRFEWRFSVQGATRDAHEHTTGRKGGFDQLLRGLSRARARGQRVTVNTCLVKQNAHTVDRLAELLVPLGVSQVHVDMVNPDEVGTGSAEELLAMMPHYSDVAPALERMVRAFPEGFDVGIGSLPYCVAPELAPWIHHDHQPMWTVTADREGSAAVKPPRFLARINSKHKPLSCSRCVFDERCSGVFATYARHYGTGELAPVTAEGLAALANRRRLVALHLGPALQVALVDLAPWVARVTVEEANVREAFVTMHARDGGELRLLFFDGRENAIAASDWCTLRVERSTVDSAAARQVTRELWSRLERGGMKTVFPPGEDAFRPLHPSVAERLRRLRDGAPFGALGWVDTVADDGGGVELALRGPEGEEVTVWLAVQGGRARGGYRVPSTAVSPPVVDGLRALMAAVSS